MVLRFPKICYVIAPIMLFLLLSGCEKKDTDPGKEFLIRVDDRVVTVVDFKSELIDRFGPLPDEAANLLLKIVLKVMAKKAGVSQLDMMNQKMILHFSESHQRNPGAMVDMIMTEPKRFELTPEYVLKARLTSHNLTTQLAQAKNLLKEIAQRVNG